MTILQDVDLNFSRVAALVGAKFELKTRAELDALEAEIAALTQPEIDAANGFSVSLEAETGLITTIYQFDKTTKKFVTQAHIRAELNVDTLNFDLSTINLRSGEKFFYLGPAGMPAFTAGAGVTVNVIGDQIFQGGGVELLEVAGVTADTITLIAYPLTRGAAAAGAVVAYFDTVDLVAGVPLSVAHNLGLVDKDAFDIRAYQPGGTGNSINLDVDGVDANNLTVTSLLPRLGVKLFITGLAA